jgi:ABC-type sugar transport system substrate-binding protein
MALFDDNFLTVLRNGMIDYAGTLDGVDLQVEDAQNDVGRQLNQIENFIASGVDAIIVNPVDTSATQAMTDAAAAANVPLVYVNREPINVDTLPANQAFVASDERESGTLEAFEVCKLLRSKGKGGGANVIVMMGELSNQAAQQRTKDVHDVVGIDMCSFMTIVEEQTGNWSRVQGADLMTNWLSAGIEFDAVISNNDEMAIGAIQSLKAPASHGGDDRRRRRRHAGRACGDAGGRPRCDRIPGCRRSGSGFGGYRPQDCQGRSRRPEGLHSLPAGDAGEYRGLRHS